MKTFKIKYLDINETIIKSIIVKGKSKYDVEEKYTHFMPEFMPDNTFYTQVIEIN